MLQGFVTPTRMCTTLIPSAQTLLHPLDVRVDAATDPVADKNHGVRRRILGETKKIEPHPAFRAIVRFEMLPDPDGVIRMFAEQSLLPREVFGVHELGE